MPCVLGLFHGFYLPQLQGTLRNAEELLALRNFVRPWGSPKIADQSSAVPIISGRVKPEKHMGTWRISGWWLTYPSEKYEFVSGMMIIPN